MIAHFVINYTLYLAAYASHAGLWILPPYAFWAAAGIALVVLVRRSGWLEDRPGDERAAVGA